MVLLLRNPTREVHNDSPKRYVQRGRVLRKLISNVYVDYSLKLIYVNVPEVEELFWPSFLTSLFTVTLLPLCEKGLPPLGILNLTIVAVTFFCEFPEYSRAEWIKILKVRA